MTKRDLVKWVEAKQKEAVETAKEAKTKAITEAKEAMYKSVGLDAFVDEVDALFTQILQKYGNFIQKVNEVEDVKLSKYGWQYGYNNLLTTYGNRATLRKEMADLIHIDTKEYKDTQCNANDNIRNVEHTYDTVVQTVKNLPTAKDGLEYLKKLGFDISEIQPIEKKKQLPATIKVNVDIKYLLLDREKKV